MDLRIYEQNNYINYIIYSIATNIAIQQGVYLNSEGQLCQYSDNAQYEHK